MALENLRIHCVSTTARDAGIVLVMTYEQMLKESTNKPRIISARGLATHFAHQRTRALHQISQMQVPVVVRVDL